MSLIKKPMLSATIDSENKHLLRFPLMASPKIDGIRCLIRDGACVSRTFKPIPNVHVRSTMEAGLKDLQLDGELMVKGAAFNKVQSGIMKASGTPDFEYWVFDYIPDGLSIPYYKRMEQLGALKLPPFCKKVLPVMINSMDELDKIQEVWLAQGFEGVMLRHMVGPYKCGRSTFKEHYLMKLKEFVDSEAKVVGFEEQLENTNEATIDELGHTKRSTHQENMVPKGTLGKFIVEEIGDTAWRGQTFPVGTGEGLTAELRQEIWDNRDKYLGKIITYKYQSYGVLNLPRLPIWRGFRSEDDL